MAPRSTSELRRRQVDDTRRRARPISSGRTILYGGKPVSGRDTPDNVADGMALVPEGRRRLFPEMTVTLPRGYESAGYGPSGDLLVARCHCNAKFRVGQRHYEGAE